VSLGNVTRQIMQGNFFVGELFMKHMSGRNVRTLCKMSKGSSRGRDVEMPRQDYKSLNVAVMIWATEVTKCT